MTALLGVYLLACFMWGFRSDWNGPFGKEFFSAVAWGILSAMLGGMLILYLGLSYVLIFVGIS